MEVLSIVQGVAAIVVAVIYFVAPVKILNKRLYSDGVFCPSL